MTKYKFNKFLISMFKIFTYFILLAIFLLIMSNVNYALLLPTRTAIVSSGSFILVFQVMQSVFGNFEIGSKKSKPVFLTTTMSVLFANLIATFTMLVMGYIQFHFWDIIWSAFLHLFIIFIIQAIFIYFMSHLGNYIYFSLFNPSTVQIISNDDYLFEKIYKHVKSHDKQYSIIDISKSNDFDMNIHEDVNIIYGVGLDSHLENELIEYAYRHNIKLILTASKYNFMLAKNNSYVVDDVLLIELKPKEITLFQLFVKRCIDLISALTLLILSIPIYIFVPIAIKIEDGGPVFFSQKRLTRGGKTFNIYKFRSMTINQDSRPAEVDDDRITKVGHFIRKFRIDELPQAINILKGDISLVGPRPESTSIAREYQDYIPDFNLRLKVKGGLTGYAQIFGKYNTTPEMKLLLDLKYIENFSIIEDLKLMLQTVIVFIRPDSTEGFENSSLESQND